MYDLNIMIERIKKLKKERKLSNEELSKSSGIPIGTLAKILGSETKDPQISNIIKIAEALDISADYLIFGEIKSSFSSDSFNLATIYENLNDEGKRRVLEYASDLSEITKYKKESETKYAYRVAHTKEGKEPPSGQIIQISDDTLEKLRNAPESDIE